MFHGGALLIPGRSTTVSDFPSSCAKIKFKLSCRNRSPEWWSIFDQMNRELGHLYDIEMSQVGAFNPLETGIRVLLRGAGTNDLLGQKSIAIFPLGTSYHVWFENTSTSTSTKFDAFEVLTFARTMMSSGFHVSKFDIRPSKMLRFSLARWRSRIDRNTRNLRDMYVFFKLLVSRRTGTRLQSQFPVWDRILSCQKDWILRCVLAFVPRHHFFPQLAHFAAERPRIKEALTQFKSVLEDPRVIMRTRRRKRKRKRERVQF